MALTSSQAEQVLEALAGKVDDNTLSILKNLLDLNIQNNAIPEGESYNNIKKYCQRLRDRLIASGRGIVAEDPDQEMLMVYMERDKVKRLFTAVPEGGYLAAMPGIHTSPTGEDQLTISLLATDKDLRILDSHIRGNINGEECWGNRNMMGNLDNIFL